MTFSDKITFYDKIHISCRFGVKSQIMPNSSKWCIRVSQWCIRVSQCLAQGQRGTRFGGSTAELWWKHCELWWKHCRIEGKTPKGGVRPTTGRCTSPPLGTGRTPMGLAVHQWGLAVHQRRDSPKEGFTPKMDLHQRWIYTKDGFLNPVPKMDF